MLERAVEELEARVPQSDFEAQRNELCVEAIECFIDTYEDIACLDMPLISGLRMRSSIHTMGVEISVRPEVVVLDPQSRHPVGAIKLYFAKTVPLSEVSASNIATVVRQAVAGEAEMSSVSPRMVSVADVMACELFEAPRAWQKRLATVEACCNEIRDRWPNL